MHFRSRIDNTTRIRDSEMFGNRRTLRQCPDRGASAPHIAQAGADVDRRYRPQWHRIGGAVWRGGAAGKKTEDLVRQKARVRHHHMPAAMAVLMRKVELPRLQQMKMLARPGHRHIEEPALLVDLLGFAACHIRRDIARQRHLAAVASRARTRGRSKVTLPPWKPSFPLVRPQRCPSLPSPR